MKKKTIDEEHRDGLFRLSLTSKMMTVKSDHILNEKCMDSQAELINEYLPTGNIVVASYYEIQRLVAGLGIPSDIIDVCVDNCIIFWKSDENLARMPIF